MTVPFVVSASPVRFWIFRLPAASIEVVPVPPEAKVPETDSLVVEALVVVEVRVLRVLKYAVEDAERETVAPLK